MGGSQRGHYTQREPVHKSLGCVVCEEVSCRRGERLIFERISLRVAPGEAVMLRGPNGAGKSSLLRLVAGFLRPSGGRISRPSFHYVPPPTPLAEALSVRETLDYWSGILGGGALDVALDHFRLTLRAETSVGSLSSGQRRRVVLSRLLLARRPLWLLDEPFASLDAAGAAALHTALKTHRDGGGMALLAGHEEMGAARDFCLPEGIWM